MTVLPRFRALGAGDIVEKSAGELVTVADREAEVAIERGLREILPLARSIGEEACAANPDLMNSLGDGLVWLIDPIDGTGNFARGSPPFAIMVALLSDGVTQQSWILHPLTGRLAYAERGGGAFLDGVRVTSEQGSAPRSELCGILSEAFLPPDRRHIGDLLRTVTRSVTPTQRCAGHEYPLVATGERDFAIYWRTLAWDHAAGALFLTEAGGSVTYEDGTPYDPLSTRSGLILARSREVGEQVRLLLASGSAT